MFYVLRPPINWTRCTFTSATHSPFRWYVTWQSLVEDAKARYTMCQSLTLRQSFPLWQSDFPFPCMWHNNRYFTLDSPPLVCELAIMSLVCSHPFPGCESPVCVVATGSQFVSSAASAWRLLARPGPFQTFYYYCYCYYYYYLLFLWLFWLIYKYIF